MGVLLRDTFTGTADAKLSSRSTDEGAQWYDDGSPYELKLDGLGYAKHNNPGSQFISGINFAFNASLAGAFEISALVRIVATSGDWADSACVVWLGDIGATNDFAGFSLAPPGAGTGAIDILFKYGQSSPYATYLHSLTGVTAGQDISVSLVCDEAAQQGYCYVDGALVGGINLSSAAAITAFDLAVSIFRDTTQATVFKIDEVQFSDGVSTIPADIDTAPRRYVADVTTDAGPVRLPISSWQSTLNVGASNYATISVPAAHLYSDTLAATTDFAITWIMLDESGAEVFEYPMFSAPAQTITYDSGPYRSTATISGYWTGYAAVQHPSEALDRTLAGVRQQSVTGTSRRYRCSIDRTLRPAQRAWHDGLRFLVDRISYYASAPSQGYMDVTVSPEVFNASPALDGAILDTYSAPSFADAAIQTTPTASASLDAQIDVP